MKKFIISVLAAVCLFAALTFAGCTPQEAKVEYTLSEDGAYYVVSGVSGNKGALKEYEVPALYSAEEGGEYKPVKEIGVTAFLGCTSLTKVTLPDTITAIRDRAFAKCGFREFTIPGSVEIIGNYAFFWCASLKEIVIPESVEQIGSCAFQDCSSLEKAVINAHVTVLYGNTFANSYTIAAGNAYTSTSLVEVHLPATVKRINLLAFDGNFIRDVYFDGTADEWNGVVVYERVKKEGTENESEDKPVDRERLFPTKPAMHFKPAQ